MKMKKASGAETRKRKASAAANGSSGSLPKSLPLVDFREPTRTEREYGRLLASRAAELKNGKRRKIAAAK
jgi:hypothetical protein